MFEFYLTVFDVYRGYRKYKNGTLGLNGLKKMVQALIYKKIQKI